MIPRQRTVLLLLLASTWGTAGLLPGREAPPPFQGEVETIKTRLDAIAHARGAVAFIGSSSIRLWTTLAADFPGRTVVNCGFGGSSIRDWIYYGPELIGRLEPAAIVMYCGENDLARGTAPESVFDDFQRFYHMLRAAFPGVPLAYISVKPSPARADLQDRMVRFNTLAAEFLRTRRAARFLDIYPLLLTRGGQPDPAFFAPDRLHLNASGYAVLKREVDDFLRERLPQNGGS